LIGTFGLISAGQLLFRFRLARGDFNFEKMEGVVKATLSPEHPFGLKAGQYINMWLLSASFWSFMQSHPFVVTSWSERPQQQFDLFIQPRRGLTRKLSLSPPKNALVIFSGPHGMSAPVDEYENVVMVASDWGIAAHLPYLKQLVNGYKKRQVRAHRVLLVWQITNYSKIYYINAFIELK
jgi:NAD(P)H-flavin reductase